MSTAQKHSKSANANMSVVIACSALVLAMAGMSYAAVPLYKIFCQVTGYGGTTQRADILADVPILDRTIKVEFDANTNRGLAWDFEPVDRSVELKLGEQKQISYRAKNNSDRPITAMATFNVTPQNAGLYFNKIECFCFTQTTLQPGEEIDMPVIFFVDPEMDQEEILKNLNVLTLSYTFYEEAEEDAPVAKLNGEQKTKVLN